MKNMLEALYYGEFTSNISEEEAADLNEYLGRIREKEEQLMQKLQGEAKQNFLEFIDMQCVLDSELAKVNFVKGFRAGAKIMVEVLEK